MNQTQLLQAVFATLVTTNVLGNGSITMSQANPVPFGTALTNTAVPLPGNYFVVWTGAASGTSNPVVLTVTNASPTIGAIFATLPSPTVKISIESGYPMLTIGGLPGQTYSVQSTTNLGVSQTWVVLTNLVLSSPFQNWLDTSQPVHQRYYRISTP